MRPFSLKTDRLILRRFVESDFRFLLDLNSDPEVMRYTGEKHLKSEEEAKALIQRIIQQFEEKRMSRFVVTHQETLEPLGWCGLKWHPDEQEVDLGYRFFQKHWGSGYATEASRACLEYGFNILALPKIVAHAETNNTGSVRVLEKLGFKNSGPSHYPGLKHAQDFVLCRDEFNAS